MKSARQLDLVVRKSAGSELFPGESSGYNSSASSVTGDQSPSWSDSRRLSIVKEETMDLEDRLSHLDRFKNKKWDKVHWDDQENLYQSKEKSYHSKEKLYQHVETQGHVRSSCQQNHQFLQNQHVLQQGPRNQSLSNQSSQKPLQNQQDKARQSNEEKAYHRNQEEGYQNQKEKSYQNNQEKTYQSHQSYQRNRETSCQNQQDVKQEVIYEQETFRNEGRTSMGRTLQENSSQEVYQEYSHEKIYGEKEDKCQYKPTIINLSESGTTIKLNGSEECQNYEVVDNGMVKSNGMAKSNGNVTSNGNLKSNGNVMSNGNLKSNGNMKSNGKIADICLVSHQHETKTVVVEVHRSDVEDRSKDKLKKSPSLCSYSSLGSSASSSLSSAISQEIRRRSEVGFSSENQRRIPG